MHLSRFPRITLAHLPTPLEHLPRLSERLGGPDIFIKRDDCTGLGTGGNKARKLEYLMGEALEVGADTVLTLGAVQSNHVRQTAAAACRLGLRCEVLLEARVENSDPHYLTSGNVFLDKLYGARIRYLPKGSDMNKALEQVGDEVRAQGGAPYLIPGGGSSPVGALGYVNCALELLQQANERNLIIDYVIHATGSAGTQAGLVAGLQACSAGIPVLGIGVNAGKELQEQRVYDLACDTAKLIGAHGVVQRRDITANCDYVGAGYGIPTDSMNEAILLLARQAGILLDPVYSGKGMAGMIDLIRSGKLAGAKNVVFVHTGGAAGLFGYVEQLDVTGRCD